MLIHAKSNFFYYFYYQIKKGTSKKISPGLYDPLYYNKPKRNKQNNTITLCIPKFKIINKKKIYFFSLQYIRMSGKTINFNNKKIEKVTFIKTKKYFR